MDEIAQLAFAVARFLELDALVDGFGAACQHRVDETRELVGDRGDDGRGVETCRQSSIVGAERRLAVSERGGGEPQSLRRLAAGTSGARRQ